MKPSRILLLVVCLAVTAGLAFYLGRKQSTAPVPDSAAPTPTEAPQASAPAVPETIVARAVPAAPAPAPAAIEPAPAAVTNVLAEAAPPDPKAAIHSLVDALLFSDRSVAEKQAVWERMRTSGKLDAIIADLKERAAADPGNPQFQTAIGVANIYKIHSARESGADQNEIGILAMQADQSFNNALKIDPANWDAQFMKAATMSHWPAELHKDDEVVQRLSSLIDQQETMPPRDKFAQTYLVLGEEYSKLGQADYALQTWKLGAAKFPNDPVLQLKISGK